MNNAKVYNLRMIYATARRKKTKKRKPVTASPENTTNQSTSTSVT